MIKKAIFNPVLRFKTYPEGETLTVLIVAFFSRMAFPGIKYFFIPAYIVFFIYLIVKYNRRLVNGQIIYDLVQNYRWFLVIGIFYGIGLLVSSSISEKVLIEFVSFLIFLSFLYLLSLLSINLNEFLSRLIEQIALFSTMIAAIAVVLFISTDNKAEAGISLVSDYNFYVVYCFLGLFCLIHNIRTQKLDHILGGIGILLILINILLSGSRRGIIILILCIGILLLLIILRQISKRELRNFRFSMLMTVGFLGLVGIYIMIPPNLKIKFIPAQKERFYDFKTYVTNISYRYATIFKNEVDINHLRDELFKFEYDPREPITWFKRSFIEVDKLHGENREIIPEGSRGCLIDKRASTSTWGGDAYMYNLIQDETVLDNDRIRVSVYCFVSEDFNGDWIRINSEGNSRGLRSNYYDLDNKESWQKLDFIAPCDSGRAPAYVYIKKSGCTDFSNLEGYVIFAYPEYRIIGKTDLFHEYQSADPVYWAKHSHKRITNLTGPDAGIIPDGAVGCLMDNSVTGSTWNGDAYLYNLIRRDNVEEGDQLYASVYCYVSEDFNGDWVRLSSEGSTRGVRISYYDFARKGIWQKLEILSHCGSGQAPVYLYFKQSANSNFSNLKGYVIFAYPTYKIIKPNQKAVLQNASLIPGIILNRRKHSPNRLKGNIPLLDKSSSFSGSRLIRWGFAWEIWKEYTLREKVFGGGFDYLENYALKFFPGGEKDFDYPHNPVISAILYSGMVGGGIYIWFLFLSLYYYLKHWKHLGIWILMYFITSFFMLFSANSHFSVPVFTFLSLIPFLFRFTQQPGQLQKDQQIP